MSIADVNSSARAADWTMCAQRSLTTVLQLMAASAGRHGLAKRLALRRSALASVEGICSRYLVIRTVCAIRNYAKHLALNAMFSGSSG